MLPHREMHLSSLSKVLACMISNFLRQSLFFAALFMAGTTTASQDRQPIELPSGQIEAFLHNNLAPSISIAVGAANGTEWCYASGYANLAFQSLATPNTSYGFASVTKAFTAVLAIQTSSNLDQPIGPLEGIPVDYQGVSLRQLLGHQAGVPHWNGSFVFETKDIGQSFETLGTKTISKPICEVGQCFRYSSPGFNLVGLKISSDRSAGVHELLMELFDDAIPNHAIRLNDPYLVIPGRARGYMVHPNGQFVHAPMLNVLDRIPAGGYSGRAYDLVKFGRWILRKNTDCQACLRPLWQEGTLSSGAKTGYGLGFRVRQTEMWHGGSQPGYSALLWIDRKSKMVVGVASNRGALDLLPLARSAAASLIGKNLPDNCPAQTS